MRIAALQKRSQWRRKLRRSEDEGWWDGVRKNANPWCFLTTMEGTTAPTTSFSHRILSTEQVTNTINRDIMFYDCEGQIGHLIISSPERKARWLRRQYLHFFQKGDTCLILFSVQLNDPKGCCGMYEASLQLRRQYSNVPMISGVMSHYRGLRIHQYVMPFAS